ncbi:MAG: antibiotic biosynthesis monooxygenase [Actinomycetes bacterium]|jgi:heme-degrading monooxygenase HmoA
MILEVAFVPVLADRKVEFEAAISDAVDTLLSAADGFLGYTSHGWGVERPHVFMFTVAWQTLEHHTVGFRESDLFTQWRAVIGPFFDGTPVVEHFAIN